jgi:type I restriction enzyme S subunit
MIPEGWRDATIGTVGRIVTGTTPPTGDRTYYGGDIPFVAPGDLGRGKYVCSSEKTISERGLTVCRPVSKGATLFTCIGSTIGKLGLADRLLATNQQINAVVPNTDNDPEFVYYQLAYIAARIAQMAGSHAVPMISKSQFAAEKIVLPPLPEQRRIAQMLSTWDRAIETVEALIANARAQKVALTQLLLTGQRRLPRFSAVSRGGTEEQPGSGAIPEGWFIKQLGDLFEFKNGLNAEKAHYGSGVKFANVMDVFRGPRLLCSQIIGSMQATKDQIAQFSLRFGDVLFNRTSEIDDEIALSTVYLDDGPAVFGGFVIRARPKGEKLDAEFCVYAFSSLAIRREMIRLGQGAIRSNIGQGDLCTVPILLPPLPEQRAIAGILAARDRAINAMDVQLAALCEEKAGLMQQLLTGKRRMRAPAEAA